jgi:hypothetical protein
VTRCYEAVASVVPGAAEHRDWSGICKAAGDLVRDGAPRILHESGTRHAAFDGEAISACHLFGSQQLKHGVSLLAVAGFL